MRKKTGHTFLIIIFLIIVVLNVIVTIHVSKNLLDDDTSGEMLLSKCLFDEKSLVCSDWEYATEIRITNQLIFAPLFGIFSEWSDVRITGTLIIQLILLFSFIFMMKASSHHTDSILLGCSLILLPYCVAYGRVILYHCYYALYISQVFLIIAFFLRVLDKKQTKLSLTILILLCFSGCLTGIRIVFIGILPLCVFGFSELFRNNKKTFQLAILCGIAGAAGFLVYTFGLTKLFHLHSELHHMPEFKGMAAIWVVHFSILRQFSYRSGIPSGGLLSIMSYAGIGTALYALSQSAISALTEKDSKKRLVNGMLFLQIVLTALSLIFFDLPFNSRFDYSRYLVPASVWVIPLFCDIFEKKEKLIQKVLFYTILTIFTGNGLINLCFFRNPAVFTQEYDGLSYRSTESITRFDDAIRFIRENNYNTGYAFKDINALSEYMNGFPIIGIQYNEGRLFYLNWLTRKNLRNSPGENLFLIANYNDAETFRGITDPELSELVYQDENELFIYQINDPDAFKSYLK